MISQGNLEVSELTGHITLALQASLALSDTEGRLAKERDTWKLDGEKSARDQTYTQPPQSLSNRATPEDSEAILDKRKAPTNIRDCLQLENTYGVGGCWTYAATGVTQTSEVPLTIDGLPVVIPVPYRYAPLAGGVLSPSTHDPRPERIDPSQPPSEEIVQDIFSTFGGCLGFYILINGFLQIVVPYDFEFEDPSTDTTYIPTTFGGLKVSYVFPNLVPTADTSTTEFPSRESAYEISSTEINTQRAVSSRWQKACIRPEAARPLKS
ncbi:hypothetical protein ABW19_dt0207967 [Dactylella cylindrospora]|nr:hypothetical protein ABW19_dt0207967 [Dactylella cylindrospora]